MILEMNFCGLLQEETSGKAMIERGNIEQSNDILKEAMWADTDWRISLQAIDPKTSDGDRFHG
jgi:hypothetical protein